MNLPAYKSLYDFSAIEVAVQLYFVDTGAFVAPPDSTDRTRESWVAPAGKTPFFTAFQAAIFEKSRPRVACFLNSISAVGSKQGTPIADNNGALRNYIFSGQLTFEIITEPDYASHMDLRAQTFSLAEMIAPLVDDATKKIGANQYMTHQIVAVSVHSFSTSIDIHQGFYGSQIHYNITFQIPPPAIKAITG